MAFNKSSIKRIGQTLDISRVSNEIPEIIFRHAMDYLKLFLYRLQKIISFCDRKTILPSDLQILRKLRPEYPIILFAGNVQKETRMSGKGGPSIDTLRKPFLVAIHDNLEPDIRLGKNVAIIIQNIVEWHVREKLKEGIKQMKAAGRETLLDKDF